MQTQPAKRHNSPPPVMLRHPRRSLWPPHSTLAPPQLGPAPVGQQPRADPETGVEQPAIPSPTWPQPVSPRELSPGPCPGPSEAQLSLPASVRRACLSPGPQTRAQLTSPPAAWASALGTGTACLGTLRPPGAQPASWLQSLPAPSPPGNRTGPGLLSSAWLSLASLETQPGAWAAASALGPGAPAQCPGAWAQLAQPLPQAWPRGLGSSLLSLLSLLSCLPQVSLGPGSSVSLAHQPAQPVPLVSLLSPSGGQAGVEAQPGGGNLASSLPSAQNSSAWAEPGSVVKVWETGGGEQPGLSLLKASKGCLPSLLSSVSAHCASNPAWAQSLAQPGGVVKAWLSLLSCQKSVSAAQPCLCQLSKPAPARFSFSTPAWVSKLSKPLFAGWGSNVSASASRWGQSQPACSKLTACSKLAQLLKAWLSSAQLNRNSRVLSAELGLASSSAQPAGNRQPQPCLGPGSQPPAPSQGLSPSPCPSPTPAWVEQLGLLEALGLGPALPGSPARPAWPAWEAEQPGLPSPRLPSLGLRSPGSALPQPAVSSPARAGGCLRLSLELRTSLLRGGLRPASGSAPACLRPAPHGLSPAGNGGLGGSSLAQPAPVPAWGACQIQPAACPGSAWLCASSLPTSSWGTLSLPGPPGSLAPAPGPALGTSPPACSPQGWAWGAQEQAPPG
ncbi:proline-rich protein 36-like [Armigeres subalbatus]|uniref:proline-rich protein 36-like n=1 Tax=Armigeres subalbatus TaxID=124917 RepID=UPI002ED69283